MLSKGSHHKKSTGDHMSDVYVTSHLKELSDGDLALVADTMADDLDEHPAYKDKNNPPCIPGPPKFREHAVALKRISAAAKQDGSKEGERQLVRENTVQDITSQASLSSCSRRMKRTRAFWRNSAWRPGTGAITGNRSGNLRSLQNSS